MIIFLCRLRRRNGSPVMGFTSSGYSCGLVILSGRLKNRPYESEAPTHGVLVTRVPEVHVTSHLACLKAGSIRRNLIRPTINSISSCCILSRHHGVSRCFRLFAQMLTIYLQ